MIAAALLLGTFLVSALVIAQLPKLTVNNSTDAFLRPDDPIRVVYDDFRRRFGRDVVTSLQQGRRHVNGPDARLRSHEANYAVASRPHA